MSDISITLLPEVPVIKSIFQNYLVSKEVHIFDYKLADFDPNSGASLTSLGTKTIAIGDFPGDPDDVYLPLTFSITTGQTTADLLVRLIDPTVPNKPVLEIVLNYQFIVETNNFGPNKEPSKYTNGYIFVPVDAGGYGSLFKRDGTPPPYDDLEDALADVMAESGNNTTAVKDLNFPQCLHLAREIVWRYFSARPIRPVGKIKKLYDFKEDDDTGEIKESDGRNEKRVRFEGEIKAHYDKGDKEARRLAGFIYAFSGAKWIEHESSLLTKILFRFPIKLPDLGSKEVNIENLAPGLVTIPAEYAYVYSTEIPVEITKEKRYEQLKTTEQDILLDLFVKAVENKIVDFTSTGKTPHQVIRLLRAQHTNRPTLSSFDVSSSDYGADLKVEELITSWSNYSGEASADFWGIIIPTPPTPPYYPFLSADDLEGHGELVKFLFVQGNIEFFNYLANRFNNIEIPGGTDSLLDISGDDNDNTKEEWKVLYQDFHDAAASDLDPDTVGDESITFLPPGSLEDRKNYFAIYACEFFGNLAVSTSDFSVDITFHPPPVFSTEQGPIQKFINAFIGTHGSLDELDDPDKVESIITDCFPGDTCAQEWLWEKVNIFKGLYQITKDIVDDCFTDEIRLTVWETLFALGITTQEQITTMSLDDFRACVRGTILDGPRDFTIEKEDPASGEITIEVVSCDLGELIHGGAAVTITPVEEEFVPINPGNLVHCVPPEYAAKTGRFAYLQDMLAFQIGDNTVADLLAGTRGLSFEDLMVSHENASLEIPRIDVVNGLLENLICNESTSVRSRGWDGKILSAYLEEFGEVIIADKALHFNEIGSVLTTSELTDLITAFGTGTCNLSGVQGHIANLFGVLEATYGDTFITLDSLVNLLNEQIAVNPFAGILLQFINGMAGIDLAQFESESVQVLETLDSLSFNDVIQFVSYTIQGIAQDEPSYGQIGNSDTTTVAAFIPEDRQDDALFIQQIAQSIPTDSSVNGRDCAYEQLAESTANPCKLPYHQPLAVSKAYLEPLGMSRFDLVQKFSQHIHGFPYDPADTPPDYKTHLLRLPVNHALALEYLGISPQEYTLFYQQSPLSDTATPPLHELLGYESVVDLESYTDLDEFLKKNCLECCDLTCWLKAGFPGLEIKDRHGHSVIFDCADCETSSYVIDVTGGAMGPKTLIEAKLWHLTWLLRFSRQLKKIGIHCYSCQDLMIITDALGWISYDADGLNPDINSHFLEQFVALDMLRTACGICFKYQDEEGKEVYLTELLQGPSGDNWESTLTYFVKGILDKCNEGKEPAACTSPTFIPLVVEHIMALAELAGFRSDSDDCYKWYFQFTNMIRFAQVLHRICDNKLTAGQVEFIFTTNTQLIGDDPYPQQTQNEAREYPFHLPDNYEDFNLDALREKLLSITLEPAEIEEWTWQKIEAHLGTDFGYTGTSFLDLGKRFFPQLLETLGYTIPNAEKQFQEFLDPSNTAPSMWNAGDDQSFFYLLPNFLTATIPLKTEAVINKLASVRDLNTDEEIAVQNLLFAPGLALTPFAAFFEDFQQAQSVLIETDSEQARWEYLQRSFALFYKKCQVITTHFTEQLAGELGLADLDDRVMWKVLAHLSADDNPATAAWENNLGTSPTMRFEDKIHGGAFAALTKLTGTGLKGTFKSLSGNLLWREITTQLSAFGTIENQLDIPVPTVIPNLDFTPASTPLIASIRNGFAHTNGSPSRMLGGAQGYEVEYKGVLYVTESGTYTFGAGAPTEEGELPNYEQASHSHWQLALQRGNTTWIVLDNHWEDAGTPGDCSVAMKLKRGAYDICFRFKQPEPSLLNMEDGCPQPTGWQIKWMTPYKEEWHTIPLSHLYHKEPFGDLSQNVDLLHDTATNYLKERYHPSISGLRRTAIRAFASGLLLHGNDISAAPMTYAGLSELDYLLNNPELFSGFAYLKDTGSWTSHLAAFNLDFLPVLDNYCPPDETVDKRANPSVPRQQALFQWFEQLWEFNKLKQEAAQKNLHVVWLLWDQCAKAAGGLAEHLHSHLGIDLDKTHLVTEFYDGLNLTCSNLLNEEWTIRIWEAAKCIDNWDCKFTPASYQDAQPAEWVNMDLADNGNDNLVAFITTGLTHSTPHQIQKLRAINEQLREQARQALFCYFEKHLSGSLFSLDGFLLLDGPIGAYDTASRLDIAIGMVQAFMNRIDLGIETLDGEITFSGTEAQLWSSQYASYQEWRTCKLRDCYPENFAIHGTIKEDSRSPGFRFLKDQLKKDVLSTPVSGGITKLNNVKVSGLRTLMPLQAHTPSTINSEAHLIGEPTIAGVNHWESSHSPNQLDFWIEMADTIRSPYLRVAAASIPYAGIPYDCNDKSCCTSGQGEEGYYVTEYHFWLIHSKHFAEIKQTYQDWDNPDNSIAELLYMQDKAVSFLGWSKIENGKPGAVQWSPIGIKADDTPIELIYKGRYRDSLWIEAANGTTDVVALYDTDDEVIAGTNIVPGFRFDLATEEVVTLPALGQLLPDAFDMASDPFYFLYHDLGAPRYPKTLHGTAYLVSQQLQANCDYKGAKEWLDFVLQTLDRDNHWEHSADEAGVKRKMLLMTYVENLLQWSKQLHQKNTPESLTQAKLILGLVGKVLGDQPKEVKLDHPELEKLSEFEPLHPGINPMLRCLYEQYASQMALLEYCLDQQGKGCGVVAESNLIAACNAVPCHNPILDCLPESPYRFLSLISKAKEYTNALSGLGNSLQAAIEKGDQEKLTWIREVQSNQLMQLNKDLRQNSVREAHFQVKALEKTLEITETRLVHYHSLIDVGLISQEEDYISLTEQSMIAQAASQGLNAVAQFVVLAPELFPPIMSDVGGGTKASASLQGGAAVASAIAGILQTRAALKNNDGGNVRREQEWIHQKNVLTIEVEQVKNQLVAARLRLLNAQEDLNNYQLQIDHSKQTLQYLRDKFTNQEFYTWQENELCNLYYELYKCTMQLAYQAEKAFNVERCYSNEQFLDFPIWDRSHRGLMAGERLSVALQRMEKCFMDTNGRWYELTKSISLYTENPRAFLMIKYGGSSLVKVSEDLFAFDHPNHYCRVYKSISITIPCVVGPYVNVNAAMTLRNSFVRTSAKILPTSCSDKTYVDGYQMREKDDRFVFIPGGKDTLATSKAVQDSGYHQLSFQDERNLTFEHAGVEAEFCFTLNQANNRFDTGTIKDIILETSYMAREGGELYGNAAAEAVKHRLPGNGELLINLPDQFPDAWYQMTSGLENQYRLELGRQDFPFLSFDAHLMIQQIELVVELAPCQECDIIEVVYQDEDCHDCDDLPILCQRSSLLGDKVYHGVLTKEFPVSAQRSFIGDFCFPSDQEVKNIYLLITYKAEPMNCSKEMSECC